MTARGAGVVIAALTITLVGCASRPVGASGTSSSTSPLPSSQPLGAQSTAASGSVAPLVLASPAAPSPDTEEARKAEASSIADSLLSLVKLPTGATPVTSPPAPELTAAPESEMTNRMAIAHAFYTVPGTIDSVLTFVQTHLPAGFTSQGGGSGGSPYEADVLLVGASTSAFEQPWLMVSATADGSLIGVRVSSQVVWLPVRTAAETIPVGVQSATLAETGVGPAAASETVTLDATQTHTLAAIVNSLLTASDAEHGCPAITWGMTLTFASTPTIVVTESACGVGLDAGEGDQLGLTDPGTLQADLNRLLGLPTDWPLTSPEPSAPPVAVSGPASSPSIMHFLCTPPGWSPLTATAEQLQEYGYPPRPDAAHDQGWLQAIKAAGPPYTCLVAASSN
jgi:hypothetical protein